MIADFARGCRARIQLRHLALLALGALGVLVGRDACAFSLLSVVNQTIDGFPSDILRAPNDHFRWDISVIRYAFDPSFDAAWPHPAIKDQIRRAFLDWEQGGGPSEPFNDYRFGGNQNFFDIRTLAVHEIGHVLGLFHPNKAAGYNLNFQFVRSGYVPAPDSGREVMKTSFSAGAYNRIPSSDERWGYWFNYGSRRLRFVEVDPSSGPDLLLSAVMGDANILATGLPSLAAFRNIFDASQGAATLAGSITFNPARTLGFKTSAQNWDFRNLTSRGISAIAVNAYGSDGPPVNQWDNDTDGNHRFTRFASRPAAVGDLQTKEYVWSQPAGVLFIPPTELIHVGLELDVWDARFNHANISHDGAAETYAPLLTIHENSQTVVTGTPGAAASAHALQQLAPVRVTALGFILSTPNIGCRVSDLRLADVTGRGLTLADLNQAHLVELAQEGKLELIKAFGSRDLPAQTQFWFVFAGKEQELPPDVLQSGNYLVLNRPDLAGRELFVFVRSETPEWAIGNYALLGRPAIANAAPACAAATEIEPNDALTSATSMPESHITVVDGAITPGGDVDFVSFAAPPNSRVWATLDTGGPANPGATSRDSLLALFDADSDTLMEKDDDDGSGNGCDSTLESSGASALTGVYLRHNGTRTLKIEAAQAGESIDPYRLFLTVTAEREHLGAESEPNDSPETANLMASPLSPVGVRSASLSADDQDYYALYLPTGLVLLHISADGNPERTGMGVNLALDLFDQEGQPLFTSDSRAEALDDPPGRAFCFLLGCGTTSVADSSRPFFVRVRGAISGGIGKYDLMTAVCPVAPPRLVCPGDRVVGTSDDGGVIFYQINSSVAWGPALNPSCHPPSGSFFKVGSHLVTCTAVDVCGQKAQCSFTVTVTPRPQLKLELSKGAIRLSWAATFCDYVVQASRSLNETNGWSPLPSNAIIEDQILHGERTIEVAAPWPYEFFRLVRP